MNFSFVKNFEKKNEKPENFDFGIGGLVCNEKKEEALFEPYIENLKLFKQKASEPEIKTQYRPQKT